MLSVKFALCVMLVHFWHVTISRIKQAEEEITSMSISVAMYMFTFTEESRVRTDMILAVTK